jgi:uncharacterized protein YkwD
MLALIVACGPMYRQPDPPPPQQQRQDPWTQQAPPSDQPPQRQPEQNWTAPPEPQQRQPDPPAQHAGTVAQRFVAAHNAARAKHCAAPLTWSPKLAAVAQKWADTLKAKGCSFGHSGGQYGENLAAGTDGVLDPEGVVAMWYDEIAKYKFPNGGFSMTTGHFTQVVWRGTTQVGCGHSECKGNDIWVCNYDPAGNWDGQYRDNVLPVGCKR